MQYNPENLKLAKKLRSNMTDEEKILWGIIRAKRFYGYKFKRQVLIGEYIVDFVCPERFLIVEIDGGQHNISENILADKRRTEYLEEIGYTVLRFWNNEIRENLSGVCEVILGHLE